MRFLFAVLLLSSYCSYGQFKLPRLISDGMVLQRNIPVKVWGWASSGEKITLHFKTKQYQTVTGQDGTWQITLPPQQAGGPFAMTFSSTGNNTTVSDILFGDVWLCSGQSNMELTMDRVKDKYAGIVATVNNPQIRQFEVPDRYNFESPEQDLAGGQWLQADDKNILRFSAVAFFFARELYSRYKIPIGLINAALGGSPAESWISENALRKFPDYYQEAQKFKNKQLIQDIEAAGRETSNQWYGELNRTDEGLKNNWSSATFNDQDWKQISIPGYWADTELGYVNGVVWFRRNIDVPQTMTGKPARILMGRIVDADSVFINGVFAGTTTYQYPPRRYDIPAGILKAGSNSITVRVVNSGGRGGFVTDKPYKLIAGNDSLDLQGTWKYRLGAKMPPMKGQPVVRWKPAGLYNGMIAPLHNYAIRGALWYQGEANTGKAAEYGSLMETLISDWRTQWHQESFPFLYVQLPGYMNTVTTPSESNWAQLRQQQLQLLSVPNTAMAVAIDIGEWNDIHPLNKLDVGRRLALQAQRLVYGDKKIVASGPLYKSITARGNKLEITFTNTGSGLLALNNKPLQYFTVAAENGKYVWAQAVIQGNKVIVWNDTISHPVSVRYAWADNPEGANLYNKEMLPASPFEARITQP